jgi:hypothetical protein
VWPALLPAIVAACDAAVTGVAPLDAELPAFHDAVLDRLNAKAAATLSAMRARWRAARASEWVSVCCCASATTS